ncbi:hypothetical protein CoNPh26_CDS0022 [Staphylococcus phage S-CoN_Ph26]|nr:hypothetical protein CoNPh26_CDS0022 [Staphylococcus phage S-CoN_Ph26]
MDNREFIQRCIVSSTAKGHDGCLLIKELNEISQSKDVRQDSGKFRRV